MVDKVKPLKFESSATGGTENDEMPRETDPSEDYLAAKGLSFEGLDTFLLQKLARMLIKNEPDDTQKPTYLGNGEIDFIEFFNSATQTTANRFAKVTLAYSGDDPISETWVIYDTNGTTVLRTLTITHTWSAGNLTNSAQVTT